MIHYLNSVVKTEQKYICVSRPRRFGKTMATKMICAYYDRDADSRSLFEKCRISGINGGEKNLKWDEYLGKFDVVRLVMTDFMEDSNSVRDMLDYLSDEVISELKEAYPDVQYGSRVNVRTVMNKIYGSTGIRFVIVIDEWDAIFREYKEDKEGQKKYLDFLRDWLKDKEYIALAYMTGILPIKKYGKHSALNMFDEYSMTQPMRLASYTGFTVEEVKKLCKDYEMDYSEISDWYDGYRVSDYVPVNKRKLYRLGKYEEHRIQVYSPLSVVNAMRSGEIENY